MCAEMFDATITDFYKEGWKEGKDGKVEFLSRVRTVEKVIYEEPTIPKPGHLKYHSREAWRTEVWQKSEARYNLTFGLKEEDKSSARRQGPAKNAEPAAAGPMQIMENALKQLKELNTKMDSLSAAANKVQYTKDDLCFRWIHLPANNVSPGPS
jgi:ferredoxin-NADP reductase